MKIRLKLANNQLVDGPMWWKRFLRHYKDVLEVEKRLESIYSLAHDLLYNMSGQL